MCLFTTIKIKVKMNYIAKYRNDSAMCATENKTGQVCIIHYSMK